MSNLKILSLLLISLLLFNVDAYSLKGKEKVSKVKLGHYDVYAFTLYEETQRFPKKSKVVAAVEVELIGKVSCDYKFILKMPMPLKQLPVRAIGQWKGIVNGQQLSDAIGSKSVTHKLDNTTYTIKGSFQSAQRKGFIRGVYRIGALPVGNYELYVFIDDEIVKKLKFKIHRPFRY